MVAFVSSNFAYSALTSSEIIWSIRCKIVIKIFEK